MCHLDFPLESPSFTHHQPHLPVPQGQLDNHSFTRRQHQDRTEELLQKQSIILLQYVRMLDWFDLNWMDCTLRLQSSVYMSSWRHCSQRRLFLTSLSPFSTLPSHSVDMSKHHPDLIMCRKQPGIGMAAESFSLPILVGLRGLLTNEKFCCANRLCTATMFSLCSIAIGRLCEKCDGKCVICDS